MQTERKKKKEKKKRRPELLAKKSRGGDFYFARQDDFNYSFVQVTREQQVLYFYWAYISDSTLKYRM